MTRLGALLLAAVALGAVLLALDARLFDEGGPGIIGFELAWDTESSQRILAEWGDDGRDAARLSLWLDFLFLGAYAAFWALLARRLGLRIWPLGLVAGALDALENVCLLVVLGGSTSGWPLAAALFATGKFLCLAVVVGAVVLRGVRRFPRLAMGLAAVGVVALAINTVLVERATEPARPDIGRVLRLDEGDLQVREDGPRGGRPVVLIHGFAVSMRWFDAVTPELARDARVVRIDLLGHGGSEKPRDGYSMEEQADLVAAAMRELGVGRAAIVGHSMGGMVATALAERHRELVARVMLIGTAADDRDIELDPAARLAFLPVTGHAVDTLIDERLVRREVERGFAPEFDPPRRLARDIFERTTYRSFTQTGRALGDYWDEAPLHERLARARVPVTVLLGEEERHTERSVGLYNTVPGARTVVMEGLDHSPHVESPARTAPLIAAFAAGR